MLFPDADRTLELVPHCSSVSRTGWVGDHDIRPLSDQGHQQADALVAALGTDVDAIFSSPALRCRQTVEPLARAANRPIETLEELAEGDGFRKPEAWTEGPLAPMAGPVAGAWAAGRMLRALTIMVDRGAGGRVVASSHGDVIPVLLATLSGISSTPLPRLVPRGGWFRIRLVQGTVAITAHDGVSTHASG
ncbi:hypothetical protein GBF35_24410 [Nonomuraea phyllanthi]|uniref:histidine phosphatase family protein n=1 Tax=Nonomuraea phyllanthi TaxID=2219224 RepID=UPI0012935712|nr:histidine phosphatase family protein [Nonomuraea phyllanthi]QFY09370.1 hypothetical protein GBF35_24410 [Nonomuraea phyllanthi]